MKSEKQAASLVPSGAEERRFFSVEEANRSLVLVRRVVKDIVDRHSELMKLRDELEDSSAKPTSGEAEALRSRAMRLNDRLVELHDELTSVGCEFKDWKSGLVDFPAMHDGREIYLCWQLGESRVEYWHELDAGFAGRRPIDFESSN